MKPIPFKSPPKHVLTATGVIFLLRHGHVDTGDGKRFIGQTELPLSQRGKKQVEFWKQWLARVSVSAVFSSDLERAYDSAARIAGDRRLYVGVAAGLREIFLGAWEGKTFDEIRQMQPEAFKARGADPAGFRPPGGESFSDLQYRVLPVFQRLSSENSGNLVIVAHAGVNRVILCHLLGMSLQRLFCIGQGPGALNILFRRADGWRIEALNLLPELLA
jgi:probable phosphoglycerate mutase